jgi:hypothetical protein
MSLAVDQLLEWKREIKRRDYEMRKRALMRGSCFVAPTIPLAEGRLAMRLYDALRPADCRIVES